MSTPHNIILLGAGLFGTSLALRLIRSGFRGRIHLIDTRTDFSSPQRWSSWEQPNQPTGLTMPDQSWSSLQVRFDRTQTKRELRQWRYVHRSAPNFFSTAHAELHASGVCRFHLGRPPRSISGNGRQGFLVHLGDQRIDASLLVDSRRSPIQPGTQETLPGPSWWQSFYGMVVDWDREVLDPGCVTLMDFSSLPHPLGFGYVLPYSKTCALVEYTVFHTQPLELEALKNGLKQYLNGRFPAPARQLEEEQGWLPMTPHSPPAFRMPGWWYGGVRGGAARAATGYAYAHIQVQTKFMTEAILSGKLEFPPETPQPLGWMDKVFLHTLHEKPLLARKSLQSLFAATSGDGLASFMAGSPDPGTIARIVWALPKIPFLAGAVKDLASRSNRRDLGAEEPNPSSGGHISATNAWVQLPP